MTDTTAMLPCPFCGEQPRSGIHGDDDGGYEYVECVKCRRPRDLEAERFVGVHAETRTDAIAAWNRRAALAGQADAVRADGLVKMDALETEIRELARCGGANATMLDRWAAEIADIRDSLHAGGQAAQREADKRALVDAAAEAWSTLDAVAEYLATREDVIDGDYGAPEPNAEMKLLREVIIDRDNLAIQITHAQGDLIAGATP